MRIITKMVQIWTKNKTAVMRLMVELRVSLTSSEK